MQQLAVNNMEDEITGNALALIEGKTELVFSTPNGLNPLIEAVKKQVSGVIHDISTKKGRDSCISLSIMVRDTKTELERRKLALTEDMRKKTSLINTEGKRAWKELEKIQKAVRQPVTDWENVEKQRVDYMERMIKHIELCGIGIIDDKPYAIKLCLRELEEKIRITPEEYKEFHDRAIAAKEKSLAQLYEAQEKQNKAAAEREELERLRKEEADRKQREHEEQIKKEAAEKARKNAEEAARIAAEKEAAHVKVEQDKLEQERLKAEREKQAEKERADKAERDRIAAEEKAKKDAEEAKAKAERDAILAAEKAEREKQEAIQKERDRVEAENKRIAADAAAREADKAYKAKINNEAMHGVLKAITENHIHNKDEAEKVAKHVIQAIAKGQVPHIKISY